MAIFPGNGEPGERPARRLGRSAARRSVSRRRSRSVVVPRVCDSTVSGSRLVTRLRGLADPGRGRDIGIAGGSGYGPHRLGLRRCPSDGHSFAGSSEKDGAAQAGALPAATRSLGCTASPVCSATVASSYLVAAQCRFRRPSASASMTCGRGSTSTCGRPMTETVVSGGPA